MMNVLSNAKSDLMGLNEAELVALMAATELMNERRSKPKLRMVAERGA